MKCNNWIEIFGRWVRRCKIQVGCLSGRQCTSNRESWALNIDFATNKAFTDDYWYTGDRWDIQLIEINELCCKRCHKLYVYGSTSGACYLITTLERVSGENDDVLFFDWFEWFWWKLVCARLSGHWIRIRDGNLKMNMVDLIIVCNGVGKLNLCNCKSVWPVVLKFDILVKYSQSMHLCLFYDDFEFSNIFCKRWSSRKTSLIMVSFFFV